MLDCQGQKEKRARGTGSQYIHSLVIYSFRRHALQHQEGASSPPLSFPTGFVSEAPHGDDGQGSLPILASPGTQRYAVKFPGADRGGTSPVLKARERTSGYRVVGA